MKRPAATRLDIAVVAPLYESVPPQLYGGTERVVSYLTEELVEMGHNVTLFASGDSRTRARLRSVVPRGLRLDKSCHDNLAPHYAMLHDVFESAPEFDIIHFHLDYLHYPVSRALGLTAVTTLHGRLDLPELQLLYRRYDDMPLVSISDAQRSPIAYANWAATIHHGLPRDFLPFSPRAGTYLAYLGRISPEKGPDRAIRIARRAGIPLRMAAKVDRADVEYFEKIVRPMLDGGGVEFVGEIDDAHKGEFLGNALALLSPIDWPEPFGLVMIEAMACGTPVITFPRGSAPELIEPGVNGWIAANEDEAVARIAKLEGFDRAACRAVFDRRFTADRMARDYVRVYEHCLGPPDVRVGPSVANDETRNSA